MAFIKTIVVGVLKALGVCTILDLLVWAGIGIGLFIDRYLGKEGNPRDASAEAFHECFDESVNGWKKCISLGKKVFGYYIEGIKGWIC